MILKSVAIELLEKQIFYSCAPDIYQPLMSYDIKWEALSHLVGQTNQLMWILIDKGWNPMANYVDKWLNYMCEKK